MKRGVIFAVCIVVLFALPALVFLWILGVPDGLFYFDEKSKGPVVSPYAMSAAMLVGVFFGVIYEDLKRATGRIDIRVVLADAVHEPGLYRALVAAPIVFSGVYVFAKTNADPIVALIFAFQNGFFCESLLKRPKPGK